MREEWNPSKVHNKKKTPNLLTYQDQMEEPVTPLTAMGITERNPLKMHGIGIQDWKSFFKTKIAICEIGRLQVIWSTRNN